jgi:YjbR
MKAPEVRTMALSLPEAHEQPHFDSVSFRIRGRIFATLPAPGDRAHIFVPESDVHEAVAEHPAWCEELWWGKKLSGLRILLAEADPAVVTELLVDAWRAKAPTRLVAAFDGADRG